MKIRIVSLSTIVLLFASMFFSGCSTDFEVNAPWKDVTILYGLLDPADSKHYVKINKAFLGPEDAYVMASTRDSSEYENIHVVVDEYVNNVKTRTFQLFPEEVENKENGTFYGPKQTVYAFEAQLLSDAMYRIWVTINEGEDDEKKVSAETTLIGEEVAFTGSYINKTFTMPFVAGSELGSPTIEWVSNQDDRRYELSLDFHYIDEYADGSAIPRMVSLYFGTYTLGDGDKTASGTTKFKVGLSGEDFYRLLGEAIPKIDESDEGLIKRRVEMLQTHITLTTAGEALHTYMAVNEPTTGIVQDKKEYTNVNNGIGIFSSRATTVLGASGGGDIGKSMNAKSIKELVFGDITSGISDDGEGYTQERGFCADPSYDNILSSALEKCQ